jgi:hypothetical protein
MAMLERRYFPTDCNGYGNQLVIDPRSQIGHCPFLPADRDGGDDLPAVRVEGAGVKLALDLLIPSPDRGDVARTRPRTTSPSTTPGSCRPSPALLIATDAAQSSPASDP